MAEPAALPPVITSAAPAEKAVPAVDNMRGALWMVGSSVCFAIIAVAVKILGAGMETAEIVFFRCLFGLSIIVPFVARQGWGVYRTQRPGLHLIRVICAVGGMNCGFYAITHLPLATAISLGFTRPLFMILLAMALLGELVRWRRGLATIVGFIGVLIVLGPTDVTSIPAAAIALAGAACVAGAMAVVRQQAATDGPATIMAWFATGTAVLTLIPALFVWQTPHGSQWLMLIFVGTVASIGQYMMIRAFTHGEATVMNPIDYSQIILTAALGYLVFAEIPSLWTAVGAVIIVTSTLYILLREAKLTSGRRD